MPRPQTSARRAPADPAAAAGPACSGDPTEAHGPSGRPVPESEESVWIDAGWVAQIASKDGIFVTDEHQRVRAWSAAAQRMLGYTADEAVGRLCYEIVMGRHPEGHPVCSTSCPVTRNARRGRGTASYEVMSQGSDGEPRYFTSNVLVLKGPKGAFRVIHMIRESEERPPCRPSDVPATGDEDAPEALTRRELEILRLFTRGMGLEEIAAELHVSAFTVRNHSTTIQHKLGVRNRLAMVLEGMRRGLV